jgi:peptidoglycan hydrolase-like protein with peptidoglycan-binding domain
MSDTTDTPEVPRDPLLTTGASDPVVPQLAQLLAALGYDPGPIGVQDVSPQLMAAVNAFRARYSVRESPADLPSAADPGSCIGPETWRALHQANAGQDVAPSAEPVAAPAPAPAPSSTSAPAPPALPLGATVAPDVAPVAQDTPAPIAEPAPAVAPEPAPELVPVVAAPEPGHVTYVLVPVETARAAGLV